MRRLKPRTLLSNARFPPFSLLISLLLTFAYLSFGYAQDTGSNSRSNPPAEPTPLDCQFISVWDESVQHYVMMDYGCGNRKALDCLIALHGHGSDRWQFVKHTRDEVQATKDFANRHSMLYISPDYRAPTSWMGPAAESDLLQIIDELQSKHQPRRIFLCGGSMGGTSALTFASLHPQLISGVASMNGMANHLEYENFQDAITESFGGTKQEIPKEYKKRSAEYWPDKLTMPVGLTVDMGDTIVPPGSCIRLTQILNKLNRPALLIERPDSGHDTNYEDATAILEFLLSERATP